MEPIARNAKTKVFPKHYAGNFESQLVESNSLSLSQQSIPYDLSHSQNNQMSTTNNIFQ